MKTTLLRRVRRSVVEEIPTKDLGVLLSFHDYQGKLHNNWFVSESYVLSLLFAEMFGTQFRNQLYNFHKDTVKFRIESRKALNKWFSLISFLRSRHQVLRDKGLTWNQIFKTLVK